MAIGVLRSEKRGHANHGWLDTYHSFSFADYYNPERMGFSVLRVINEDRIAGGMGFPLHGHANMEIITFVISGTLSHKDTLGNSTMIRPGEIQRMSAGTGIRHSEFNAEKDKETHLLQIWILPNREGHQASYEQKSYLHRLERSNFILLASESGESDSISLHQDIKLFLGKTKASEKIKYEASENRKLWLQVVKGEVRVGVETLKAGDALATEKESVIDIEGVLAGEFLLFDLPEVVE